MGDEASVTALSQPLDKTIDEAEKWFEEPLLLLYFPKKKI